MILQQAERIRAETKVLLDNTAADFAAARPFLLKHKQSRVFACQYKTNTDGYWMCVRGNSNLSGSEQMKINA